MKNKNNNSTVIVKVIDIVYDTDYETLNLPTELTFELDNDFDIENGLADVVSEETGYSVNSLNYQIMQA
jgi:hypothetical protein